MKYKYELVTVKIGKIELDCKVKISPYIHSTRETPEEGGIDDLELENIYYKGFDVFELLREINDIVEIVIDKCKDKLR